MFSVGSKKILFMANAVSPPVEPAPAAINVMFAIQAGHIGFLGSFCLRRILFKLWQRGIHLVPRVRVRCPDIYLRVEPARIIQARSSDRDKLRDRVGLDLNGRAAFKAKAPMGLATHLTGRGMEA